MSFLRAFDVERELLPQSDLLLDIHFVRCLLDQIAQRGEIGRVDGVGDVRGGVLQPVAVHGSPAGLVVVRRAVHGGDG